MPCWFITFEDLLDHITKDQHEDDASNPWDSKLPSIFALMIDDIGIRREMSARGQEFRQTHLLRHIEWMLKKQNRRLILTTNVEADDWADAFGERTASRLNDIRRFARIEIPYDDIRSMDIPELPEPKFVLQKWLQLSAAEYDAEIMGSDVPEGRAAERATVRDRPPRRSGVSGRLSSNRHTGGAEGTTAPADLCCRGTSVRGSDLELQVSEPDHGPPSCAREPGPARRSSSSRTRNGDGGGLSGRLCGSSFLHESSGSRPRSNQIGFVAFELLTKYSEHWKRVRLLYSSTTR